MYVFICMYMNMRTCREPLRGESVTVCLENPVYIYLHTYIHALTIPVYIYTHTYVHTYISIYIHIQVFLCVYIYIFVRSLRRSVGPLAQESAMLRYCPPLLYLYTNIYMCQYSCLYIYICICICIYIHIYIYIYIGPLWKRKSHCLP